MEKLRNKLTFTNLSNTIFQTQNTKTVFFFSFSSVDSISWTDSFELDWITKMENSCKNIINVNFLFFSWDDYRFFFFLLFCNKFIDNGKIMFDFTQFYALISFKLLFTGIRLLIFLSWQNVTPTSILSPIKFSFS